MNIFFIGTVEFSKSALDKLVSIGANVVGVATKKQSSFNSDFADVSTICVKHNIPCHFLDDINSIESIQIIRALKPDVIYCFGWSSLIKEELLKLAPLGVVGFHPTQLPKNRGRHPVLWALVLGIEQTASTFFFMDKGADSGPILSQKIIPVDYNDDARTLYNKITLTALPQIEEFTNALSAGKYEKREQDHDQSNIWRKRGKRDGLIDFRMSSRGIYYLVRALTKPYVGAHIEKDGAEIKVWKVEEVKCDTKNVEPGKVLESSGKTFLVKTFDGSVRILEHEFTNLPTLGEYL
jgi:methionyl-tRNA formyltransferase